jgi:TonB family protein
MKLFFAFRAVGLAGLIATAIGSSLHPLAANETTNTPLPRSIEVPPKLIKAVKPVYPSVLRRHRVAGEVVVRFVVDKDGNTADLTIISSTHKLMEEAAIDAVLKWKFNPALKNGKPAAARMQLPVVFAFQEESFTGAVQTNKPSEGQIRKIPGDLWHDTAPTIANVLYPVYPYDLLVKKIGGKAQVDFLVGVDGLVTDVRVVKADRAEFGEALAAAVAASVFEPASHLSGKSIENRRTASYHFDPSGKNTGRPFDSDLDVLSRMLIQPDSIRSGKELDALPKPMLQCHAVMPTSTSSESGSATIEIIIDEKGRACLPRILKASEPAFGYAAAQSVGDWLFTPPVAKGEPVLVRVAVPVNFSRQKIAKPTSEPAASNNETSSHK